MNFRIPLACALCPLAPALAAIPEPTGLGTAIRASADEEPAFALAADGVNVYECKATPDGAGHSWYFVAPDATLFEGSRSVGTHRTANLWESSSDRSSVSGVLRSTQSAGASNLPWAIFRAQPLSPGGIFAGVTSVQRVNTSGGTPPATPCAAGNAGAEARIAFRADFYFYKRRAG